MTMLARVFLDTSYAVALAIESDQYHQEALRISKQLSVLSTKLIITQAVLLEIGNSLSKQRYRNHTAQALRFFNTDPIVEVVPLSSELYERGLQLFESRKDKEWGLVDCISFVVMQDRGLKEALTIDEHFEQAGFVALLRT